MRAHRAPAHHHPKDRSEERSQHKNERSKRRDVKLLAHSFECFLFPGIVLGPNPTGSERARSMDRLENCHPTKFRCFSV